MGMKIKSYERIVPMIYAYTTPDISYHDGWTKIGYTEKQSVEQRIRQQTHTVDVRFELSWQDNAMYKDGSGEYFTDHDFHDYLESTAKVKREKGTEWFNISGDLSHTYFTKFASRISEKPVDGCTYILRKEQAECVARTEEYFKSGGEEFLWNAKPRFGKTLTAYDLICKMGFTKVLIVTNRPSIANSWADDFRKFIGWQYPLVFVSNTDALQDKEGVLTREEYVSKYAGIRDEEMPGFIAFESLQGIKGSVYFGGEYDKLHWMAYDESPKSKNKMVFDLLIVDESQEGVDTKKTDKAFANIRRKHTLYLSGTPFKALADGRFSASQIYNWSYADEQAAKEAWNNDDYNPYEQLPRLALYTYQLSNMIYEKINRGADLEGENDSAEFCFDLNEFFATAENGRFVHEDEVIKFLHALSTQEKYPYSTPKLREELSHTLWILNRVASAKALAKLLREDEVFGEYEIILAAGDGQLDDDDEDRKDAAFDRVKSAIAMHDRTITLSVGQLTVGVTIPEWSGVLMLANMQSPSSYMQAAFRAQNPCVITRNGERLRKETAYIFDFDPARTLVIFDNFANNLAVESGTSEDRKQRIKTLLNFFPVIGEDDEGRMVELDAAAVLSIPRRLKSVEVVRRGFISNFLFQNISNVFGAPSVVTEIVKKLSPAQEEKIKPKSESLDHTAEVPVDADGNVDIPKEIVIGRSQDIFGDKIYGEMLDTLEPQMRAVRDDGSTYEAVKEKADNLAESVKNVLNDQIIAPIAAEYGAKKSTQARLEKQAADEINSKLNDLQEDYEKREKVASAELKRSREEANSEDELKTAEDKYSTEVERALNDFVEALQSEVSERINNKPVELIEQMERIKAEEEKKTVEDTIRAHLRGFSRTIPSFIMAYGDEELTLGNFDSYTEADVFEEVTGITLDDFRFLRDGGDINNESTGETEHFAGQLFDEIVFNDSVKEFLHKKEELADYFDESVEEDIFDYIPPQKTSQIFTPKWVVKKMVDELEEMNPGCFDDPLKTFIDLYMKSGLYITEIVKRLYRSENMKKLFPDDRQRIEHILQEQVYGVAPTRIIYLIATNFILGFDETLKSANTHFIQFNLTEAARCGRAILP